jgi:hypothetical protein
VNLSTHTGLLRAGRNVLALYGEKNTGRRAIDAGLYTLVD